jgi:Phosphotransferase enzyme family
VIDGERYILKHLHCDDDWIMRATGDVTSRPLVMWQSGLFDALPPEIDHTIAGCATGLGRNGWGAAVLMRDVGEHFLPEGGGVVPLEQHLRFLDHMAALHARFWGFRDTIGLTPIANRYVIFTPWLAKIESGLSSGAVVPTLVPRGWEALHEISPRSAELVDSLLVDDSSPLLDALARTPMTLVHSDFKFGNLGSHPDDRTILVDWAFPGEAPACADLAWYLGVNCRRLPQTKDQTIDEYRAALERRGVATAAWWDTQLGLSLIGHYLQMSWSKTLEGRDDEFTWWEQRTLDAERYLL